ncbi:MAG TPA: YgaP-like transmembrane domain [Bryobacteraceae bacterium]|nr:YgaP-like transmembrane domain [Bryobacteraceae bacterium]
MTLRTGVYIVPTNRWYIERTVWLIAGVVLLASTALALLVNPLWILGVTATGLVSINVAFTGFCPVGSVLRRFGFTPMLGAEKSSRWNLYFMQTDKWYLERRIYLAVGFNISVASALVLAFSPWVTLFTIFVGGAMVWFAATGFCVMANGLYWLGAEPRLTPEAMPSGRCEECAMSGVCLGGHPIRARKEDVALIEPPAPLIQV